MNATLDRWPKWSRWVLLLPAALLGGFLAGIFIEFISSFQATSAHAPLLFIAAFLGGLAGTWAAFHIAYCFAPSHKRTVVIVLGLITIMGHLSIVHLMIRREEYVDLLRLAGDLVACYVAWRKYVQAKEEA